MYETLGKELIAFGAWKAQDLYSYFTGSFHSQEPKYQELIKKELALERKWDHRYLKRLGGAFPRHRYGAEAPPTTPWQGFGSYDHKYKSSSKYKQRTRKKKYRKKKRRRRRS